MDLETSDTPNIPKSCLLTMFQVRALRVLRDAGHEGAWHEDLYPKLFPRGKFNTQRDSGSVKGGPSRVQCAVTWTLAKRLGGRGWATNSARSFDDRGCQRWRITADGLKVLREWEQSAGMGRVA